MLRRIAWVLRVTALTAGVAVLLWLPVSYCSVVRIQLPFPTGRTEVSSSEGLLLVFFDSARKSGSSESLVQIDRAIDGDEFTPAMSRVRPHWSTVQDTHAVYIPLWLLAVLCLAWPVTSFLLARRRRKRGFPIEPAPEVPRPQAEAERAVRKG